MAICGRVFALQSRFGVAACTATRAIFCIGVVARLRLAFARHYGERSLRRIVFVSSPGKGKGPFGRAGLRENLRPGGEPGLTQGGGVRCLILGGAPVRTALGWQANWEGDPAFARQKYKYGFSRSCETVLNDLCTQGTCARQDVKGLMGAIKQHLT